MGTQRVERVSRQILQEISNIVEFNLADPRLSMITFTDVRMTPDLRNARVCFSLLGDRAEREAALLVLEKATGLLRRELGRRLRLKYVPQLRFEIDDSLEHSERISRLTAGVVPNDDDSGTDGEDRDDG